MWGDKDVQITEGGMVEDSHYLFVEENVVRRTCAEDVS